MDDYVYIYYMYNMCNRIYIHDYTWNLDVLPYLLSYICKG